MSACALTIGALTAGASAATADEIGYVTNQGDNTVTSVDLTTGAAGTPFGVGSGPAAVALTPDGSTLLVANSGDNTVTPVSIGSGSSGLTYTPGTPIPVGPRPEAVAVTANGMTAYVADDGSDTITPITLDGVDIAGTPLTVATGPNAIALTPNGELAYVTSDSGWVTPINTSTNGVSETPPAIHVGSNPDSIVIAPNGSTGYVTDSTSGTITRFAIPSDVVLQPFNVGATPNALAITPNGLTMWIADNIAVAGPAQYALTSINLQTDAVGASVLLPAQPSAVTISADGGSAYVTEYSSDEVIPIDLATGVAGPPITVGANPSSIALAPVAGAAGATGTGSPGGSAAGSPGGSAPSSGGASAPYTFPLTGGQTGTVGDQAVTLLSSATTTSPTASCLAAKGSIKSTLTAKALKKGVKVKFTSALFTLGKHSKTAKRLPAKVSLPLTKLSPGRHSVVVTVRYTQQMTKKTRRSVKMTLRSPFKIC